LACAGLLIQDKFHGLSLGNWKVAVWTLLGLSLLFVFLTTERIRPYRPTAWIDRGPRFASVRFEAPEKRLPMLRPGGNKKREIEIGHRAIKVGSKVLEAVGRAQQKTHGLPGRTQGPEEWEREIEQYQATYQEALHEIKTNVGAAWAEILHELDELGERPQYALEISVNFTGLDEEAMKVQAVGRKLLRRHGIEPPGS
jgi:hypothetical protein